jgi:uncharacterized protein YutE (UPF0331/DUF86 family)
MPLKEQERRFLTTIAAEYEDRGYAVKLQPAASDMPEFLANFQPDLLATGNGESVVVEVKARRELANDQPIAALEAALRNRPGWRFELIVHASEPEQTSLGLTQIAAALEEANELHRAGHITAALLLLWSATEGILRVLAAREDIDLESQAALSVITHLYTLGVLEREQDRILHDAVHLRNLAAHGYEVSVTRQDVANVARDVTNVARELLSELESKAA